jgi:predicted enzyme related to lactoylglutathione lyase
MPSMLKNAPIRAYIPVSDLARARRFYEETVGLAPKEEYAGGVTYECGGAEVFLYPTPNAGTSKASQAFWQVEDVESEVAELKARGVKFEEYNMPGAIVKNSIATAGGAKTAWFKDTEGNILAVSQRPMSGSGIKLESAKPPRANASRAGQWFIEL